MLYLEKIRTFIAINIPASIRKQIAEFQSALKRHDVRVSWTKPENIHITLKFLGDVEIMRIDEISNAVVTACQDVESFVLAIKGTGFFPNRRNPKVLWIGCEGDVETLFSLYNQIEQQLFLAGFKKEKRKYSSHLTIGRVKSNFGIQSVVNEMETSSFDGGEFEVKHVNVMKSVLNPNGAIYTVLSKVDLN